MSNRNRTNIRKFPAKAARYDVLKQAVNGIADDMVSSFSEMISAKTDALSWAIDQLPKMLEAAGLPQMQFDIGPGLLPFLLSGFADIEDDEDTDEEDPFAFDGMYPCFTAEEESGSGDEQYDLVLSVNEDEEEEEEGSRRIDAFLTRVGEDGSMYLFDGESWNNMEDMLEDEDDIFDDDDLPFN